MGATTKLELSFWKTARGFLIRAAERKYQLRRTKKERKKGLQSTFSTPFVVVPPFMTKACISNVRLRSDNWLDGRISTRAKYILTLFQSIIRILFSRLMTILWISTLLNTPVNPGCFPSQTSHWGEHWLHPRKTHTNTHRLTCNYTHTHTYMKTYTTHHHQHYPERQMNHSKTMTPPWCCLSAAQQLTLSVIWSIACFIGPNPFLQLLVKHKMHWQTRPGTLQAGL